MAARPDAGWSWVIAFSCSYIHLALFGIFRSAGVIFVALLDTYDTTREEAAWPFSLCSAIFQLTAPIASIASHYVSVRKICLLGSLVATVGISCCFFAHNVLWIIIFYGVIHGLGFGLVAALVPVIVNQYFVRHRATGVGIAFSGGTVSTFIFPVAMEFVLHIYGLQGTFLLLGGIVMNTLVASSLLRAPPWLEQKRAGPLDQCPPRNDPVATDCKLSLDLLPHGKEKLGSVGVPVNNGPQNPLEAQHLKEELGFGRSIADESTNSPNHCSKEGHTNGKPRLTLMDDAKAVVEDEADYEGALLIEHKVPCDESSGGQTDLLGGEFSEVEKATREDFSEGTWQQNDSDQQTLRNNLTNGKYHAPKDTTVLDSLPQGVGTRNGIGSKYTISKDEDGTGVAVPLMEDKSDVVIKEKDNSTFGKEPNRLESPSKWSAFVREVVEVMSHPMFHILTISMCFFFLSVHTFFMVTVDFAMDKGIPESHAIYVLSVFSATDFLGRAGLGWVTDRNYIKRKNMVMINLGVVGVLNNFYPLANTVTGLFTISAFHGLAVGSTITLFFVLQAEYLGMKRLPLVIGLTSFINGITTFFRPAMTGLFRDEIGSYDLMFHFLGVLMLLISAAWLAEPWLRKRSKSFDDEDILSSRFTDLRKSSC